jgi:hypothetical protein
MVHATGTSTSAKLLNFSDGNITVRGKPCTVCTVPMVIAVRIRKEAASYKRLLFQTWKFCLAFFYRMVTFVVLSAVSI